MWAVVDLQLNILPNIMTMWNLVGVLVQEFNCSIILFSFGVQSVTHFNQKGSTFSARVIQTCTWKNEWLRSENSPEASEASSNLKTKKPDIVVLTVIMLKVQNMFCFRRVYSKPKYTLKLQSTRMLLTFGSVLRPSFLLVSLT